MIFSRFSWKIRLWGLMVMVIWAKRVLPEDRKWVALQMGLAKLWKYSGGLLSNLAAVVHHQHKQHFVFSCFQSPSYGTSSSPSQSRRSISWTAICGFMLFALGLISLFTGHVASNLEWYSHRIVKRTWFYKLVM